MNQIIDSIAWYAELDRPVLPIRVRSVADVQNLESLRTQLPEKVQLLSVALRGRAFEKGVSPYQDFDLLLAIRHRIVHPRPSRVDVSLGLTAIDEPRKIRQGLVDRGLLHREDDARLPWTVALSNPDSAVWAFNTAYHMGRAIADCFPRGKWRNWAHRLNPLTPESVRAARRSRPVPDAVA